MFNATWVLTLEAGCMPRFSQRFYPSLASTDRPMTQCTFYAKQFLIVLFTIWFSPINIEAFGTDLLAAMTADEVLRMECLPHSLNARPNYRLLTSFTMRSKELIEVFFTVKFSAFLNEALVL